MAERGSLEKGGSWQTKAEPGTARYSGAQSGKARYSAKKTNHVLYFWKACALRISNMILRGMSGSSTARWPKWPKWPAHSFAPLTTCWRCTRLWSPQNIHLSQMCCLNPPQAGLPKGNPRLERVSEYLASSFLRLSLSSQSRKPSPHTLAVSVS